MLKQLALFFSLFIGNNLLGSLAGCQTSATTMNQDETAFFEPVYQPIARAIWQSDLATIDRELATGLDVNYVGEQNMTLLMWAIVCNNKFSLTHLLEKGADPNYKDAQGTQPVGFAASLDDIDYLRILLDHKGDPNSEDRGRKALITTVFTLHKEHMYLLLDKGAYIDAVDKDDHVPAVVILADLNQFEDVAQFISRGASHKLVTDTNGTLPHAVQDAAPNTGTDGYEWQKKVKQMLEVRGVVFPVEAPYYNKPAWLPIRQRWYDSLEGQPFKTKLKALGRDPEGFGDAYRDLVRAEDDAFEAWMAKNNIREPED